MEDEYYPAISPKTATSNLLCGQHYTIIDPKCYNYGIKSQASIYSTLNKITASPPLTFDNIKSTTPSGSATISLVKQQTVKTQAKQMIPQKLSVLTENEFFSPGTSRNGCISPDICFDIGIDESYIKDEPMSPDSKYSRSPSNLFSCGLGSAAENSLSLTINIPNVVFESKHGCLQLIPASENIVKSESSFDSSTNYPTMVVPEIDIKTEPPTSTSTSEETSAKNNHVLPLTHPSSISSDESEDNLSSEYLLYALAPSQSKASAHVTLSGPHRNANSSSSSSSSLKTSSNINNCKTRQPIRKPLISTQPKGSTGNIILTEEEKRNLLAEGYPIPQKLPLTKAEEKSLRKIRRKIKNKISAQESRRKKREYVDQLEHRVEILENENSEYKKRVKTLEDTNASLLSQMKNLQSVVNKLKANS